ncbi:MAG TPA: hypothetical protein VNF73_17855 [Candidatus Saccharimonadales bacterium]|nr:hypothetical protein [Candidatus Saccharimonadales bacterium]
MPLEFLKRGRNRGVAAAPPPEPEEIEAQDYSVRIHYGAKGSDGVRMKPRPGAVDELSKMLGGLVDGPIELVEPLPVEFGEAAPVIERPTEAMQWLNAHHDLSPITLHALMVLETLDAIDLAFDTFACALLDGETDTSGYPLYNAIVGGVASHWDESTGELIVRAVAGWGGKGVRGDTERTAGRLLAGIFNNVLASQYALGIAPIDRPMPAAGRGGLVCAHCGFASAHERAFYCPKCGMRLLRG